MELAGLTCHEMGGVRVSRKALEEVLEQCQLALQQLASGCDEENEDDDRDNDTAAEVFVTQNSINSSAPASSDTDTDTFYGLLESRVGCADFLEKLEKAQASHPQNNAEEGSSWDMVSKNDIWGGGNLEVETEDYVLVRQEDIVDGIATFMAAYLLSLEKAKDLTPNQLQEALRKTFSIRNNKGKLRKAWDGSKLIYNVTSWGATAIGIYQNPAIVNAASAAFWTSYRVISKLF